MGGQIKAKKGHPVPGVTWGPTPPLLFPLGCTLGSELKAGKGTSDFYATVV